MSTEFVHLHVHTDFSLLDGACEVGKLAALAKDYHMPALAITDHGAMGGAIKFYNEAKKKQIKPIIGCEMYVSPTNRFDKDPKNPDIKGFHLVLLAKDFTGYQNLCQLNSAAALEGMYYKPRIDKELLAKYSTGLIGLSACLKGEVPDAILKGDIKRAKKLLQEYLDIIGRDNFYLEIMDHGLVEQKTINKELVLLAKEFDLPLVATNDVHYLKKEHVKSHEILLCIHTNNTMTEGDAGAAVPEGGDESLKLEGDKPAGGGKRRFQFGSDQFYLKTGDEMRDLFKEIPEAITNTLAVAERCDLKISFVPEVNHYPVYQITDGSTTKETLRNICLDGIPGRYGFDPRLPNLTDEQRKIVERMDFELGVIDKAKYNSYFLVVWDFIDYAKRKGIPVGPGRGSGAGSLVAYLTHITNIDPLKYNLLFERFLNPERVSPPDFDIDFCERRRSEVIEYVRAKYGDDSVAQIGTYNTLRAKAVIKDVGRVLGLSFALRNDLTKLIPTAPDMTLAKAQDDSSELRDYIAKDELVRKIFEYGEPLEDLNRNMGIHAAGVIIGDQPLRQLVPLTLGANKEIITQYEAGYCENLGLLKMDFLGLRTLTVIQDTIDNVKKSRGISVDIDAISLEDKKAYELLNKGDTVAVFQLESDKMQDLCRRFGITGLKDIIALIALYRPGPMEFIPDFIARKCGGVKVEYDHPKMEPILSETCGIMLYQEQVMQVVQALAGFTLGGADILRRAMGKKKVEEMMKQKEKFVKGCFDTNNIPPDKASAIWEKIEKFAGYGFNKSHSAVYALLAYRTAYLKAHYPAEFMTATLASEITDAKRLSFLIGECRSMGIKILPPDVNVSEQSFTVDGDSIRFGLAAIKGVGESAAISIIEPRVKDGKYKSIMDFSSRVGAGLNTRVVEGLARAGAFCTFKIKRSQLVELKARIVSQAHSRAKELASGQGSLFDLAPETDSSLSDFSFPDIPEFHEKEMLKDEKELLGFYVSGHPLGEHIKEIKAYSTHSIPKALDLPPQTRARLGGICVDLQFKTSKKSGERFIIFRLEDTEADIECALFSRSLEKLGSKLADAGQKIEDILAENTPLFAIGTIQGEDTEPRKLIVDDLITLPKALELHTREVHIRAHEASTALESLTEINSLCAQNPGKARLVFCIICAEGEIVFIETSPDFSVTLNPSFTKGVQDIIGENCLHYKADNTLPKGQERHWERDRNKHNGAAEGTARKAG